MDTTNKTFPLPVNQPNIERTGLHLLDDGRWCVWTAQPNPKQAGKFRKIPTDGVRALDATKTDDWLSYSDAIEAHTTGRFAGVGLLMGTIPGLVGIDLDGVLCDGAVIEDKRRLVADLESIGCYIEVSPSGRGLRAFTFGKIPPGFSANSGDGVEIYDGSEPRYLTVTGQPWRDESRGIRGNQGQLDLFVHAWSKPAKAKGKSGTSEEVKFPHVERSDDDVLGLLLAERFDPEGRYLAIYSGEVQTQSEERWELLKQLAYFTRDEDQIEKLMRRSRVDSSRFDEKRGKYGTRLRYEIARVLDEQIRNYDADKVSKSRKDKDDTGLPGGVSSEAEGDNLINHLIGGADDLKTKTGWRRDPWALTELLLRDRRLVGVCFWNEFSNWPMLTRSLRDALNDPSAPDEMGMLTDAHLLAVMAWFGRHYRISIKKDQCADVVARWAQSVRVNPVRDRLDYLGARWDSKPRLNEWLIRYCGAETETESGANISRYVEAVGSRWLVSVVARGIQPGCKADTMLVIEGRQGARKSSAVRVIAEAIDATCFREGFALSDASKDTRIALRGRLIVEWAELTGLTRRDANEIKNFLTLRFDSYRTPYGVTETDWPRSAVFCGTTNDSTYLNDPSGNRRFWPVKVGRIDLDALQRDAEQIIGEAVVRYRNGERWWFDDSDPRDELIIQMAERETRQRLTAGLWDERAAEIAERMVNAELITLECVIAADIKAYDGQQMRHWLSAQTADDQTWIRIAAALRRAGWESIKSGGRMKWRLQPERRQELRTQRNECRGGLSGK